MLKRAADFIRTKAEAAGKPLRFRTAVVLGSGLGAAGQLAIDAGGICVDYHEIPGMPQPAVAGHAGRLIIGRGIFEGVLLLQGRVHYYEGHSLAKIIFSIEMLHELGLKQLIVTNAAGGITTGFHPGDLMLISGHWSFVCTCENSAIAGRTSAADALWNTRLLEAASCIETPLTVHQGVYAMMSGPNYETPAEVRMLRTLGVDAVGMSTIPEALAAARRGMLVLGISCITNIASGLSDKPLDHAEVSEAASGIESEFTRWLINLLSKI